MSWFGTPPRPDAIPEDEEVKEAAPPTSASPEVTDPTLQNATESQIAASKDQAITTLLQICAANNIDINDNLRRAILGEELYDETKGNAVRRDTFSKRESILGALVRSHSEDVKRSYTETEYARVRYYMIILLGII